jgi:glycosyltransferase involved in cell wall biosynthesis
MNEGISIIIPTYNSQTYLAEAIQSVLDQDYQGKIEIIVCDDGSSDNSLSLAESFGDRVVILKKPKDCKTQGVSSTRNRGIKASSQKFICFLDSDDFYLPNHFKSMIPIFNKDAEIGFAFCRVLEVKEENGMKLFKPWTHKKIFKNDIINPVVSRTQIVHTNSFIFKREVFDKAGIFNEGYSNGEDGDLWMRISEKFKGAFSDHFGTVYRMHSGAHRLTSNAEAQVKKCYLAIYESAAERYYQLGLEDSNRIFKITHMILNLKFRSQKHIFYFKYFLLILQYPFAYLNLIPVSFYQKLEKKERKEWKTFDELFH